MKELFLKLLVGEECDVDECLIEHFGKYSSFLKQSIRLKPNQFGYKLWYANFVSGFLLDFVTRKAPAEKPIWLKSLALVLG